VGLHAEQKCKYTTVVFLHTNPSACYYYAVLLVLNVAKTKLSFLKVMSLAH